MRSSKIDYDALVEVHGQMGEAVSILMCAEDSTQEDHVRRALGVAIGTLVTAWQTVEDWKEDAMKSE